MLRYFPVLATLATGTLACFSVVYDLFYFFAIDGRLFLLLNLPDHITSFVSAIPAFLISQFQILFQSAFSRSEKEIERNKDFSPLFKYKGHTFYVSTYKYPKATFAILWGIFLADLLFGIYSSIIALTFPVVMTWRQFSVRLLNRLSDYLPPLALVAVYLLPITIFLSASYGYYRGSTDMYATKGNYNVVFTDGRTLNDTVLIRSADFGLIIRDPARQRVLISPWSEIKSMERSVVYPRRSLARRIYDYFRDML